MDLGAAGLFEQPFPTHGKPLCVVSYASESAAVDVLSDTCEHPTGISLLQGPTLSGKSTLIRKFVDSRREDASTAIIDGTGLNTTKMLISVLRQFGYDPELSSANELLGLVRVFALQQTVSHEAPLLIIENSHDLNPSALRSLCELAELRVRIRSALKLVLVSDRSLHSMVAADAMAPIAKRVLHNFHLRPMSCDETQQFLQQKLRSAGSNYPEFIFPDEVCQEIWRASAGWPGVVDRVAILALAQTDTLPVATTAVEHRVLPSGTWIDDESLTLAADEKVPPDSPRLTVTSEGSVKMELTMDNPRALVGRSEHNDIAINSRFVSRHHALLVRDGDATFLLDLNSSNGTFVNSKRVSNYVLMHDDVITIGHHHIKFHDPRAIARCEFDDQDFANTTIMKTLDDMRDLLAHDDTVQMPAEKDDVTETSIS